MKKLFLLIIPFLLTGCSYLELNNLAIASAVGVDYKDNNFILTAQIMNVKSNNSGTTEPSAIIYTAKGKTLAEANRNFYLKYPKNIYFEHLEMMILSKEAVNNKLEDIFDYFIRSPEARTTAFVLISENKTAGEILNPNNEKKGSFPTEDIKSVLKDASNRNGSISQITLEDFFSTYLKDGIDPIVPLIKAEAKDNTASSTIINGMVPIKDGKITKKINNDEAIVYNLILNNFQDIIISPYHNSKPFAAIIYNPKSKIDVKLKNDKVIVNIDIKFESKINEIDQKIDLTKEKNTKILKKTINQEINKYTIDLIKYLETNNIDILGIKNELYKNYKNEYKKFKNKNIYDYTDFNINITNNMYRYGNINKGAS